MISCSVSMLGRSNQGGKVDAEIGLDNNVTSLLHGLIYTYKHLATHYAHPWLKLLKGSLVHYNIFANYNNSL